MKINLKVRLKNPNFIFQVILSTFGPVLLYYGLTGADLTTWGSLLELIKDAISNPFVLATMAGGLYNALIDPTTKGLGDSNRALHYTEPKNDDFKGGF